MPATRTKPLFINYSAGNVIGEFRPIDLCNDPGDSLADARLIQRRELQFRTRLTGSGEWHSERAPLVSNAGTTPPSPPVEARRGSPNLMTVVGPSAGGAVLATESIVPLRTIAVVMRVNNFMTKIGELQSQIAGALGPGDARFPIKSWYHAMRHAGGRLMTKLSLFDQLFYKAEKAGLPRLYLAGVMIMDPAQAPHKLTAQILAEHLAARMEKIPLMRKKIVQDALRIGSVRLVDDPQFDVRKHIMTVTLKAPGGYKEFTEYLGAFSARPLDLSLPPWHYEVIDGLSGGRMALAIHVHHCVMDGLGTQDVLSSIYDAKPVKPEKSRRRKWQVTDESKGLSLLSSAMLENAERVFVKTPKYLLRSGLPLAKLLTAALAKRLKLTETLETGSNPLPVIRKTSLNSAVSSSKRVVAYIELPIEEALAIRKHFECSINDLALVLNSVALEHYFKGIREKVDFDLVAVMPMNARKEGETGPGNVLTIGRVNLHNTEAHLGKRLRAIASETAMIKSKHRAPQKSSIDGRSLMDLFSPLIIDSLCFAVAGLKLTSRVVMGNIGITNVPGSKATLYIAGAPVVSGVPMAPVIAGVLAVTITVSSTDKYLLFGYHGDGAVIKEKDLFVEGAGRAFEKLKSLAGRKPSSSPKTHRKARRVTRAAQVPVKAKSAATEAAA